MKNYIYIVIALISISCSSNKEIERIDINLNDKLIKYIFVEGITKTEINFPKILNLENDVVIEEINLYGGLKLKKKGVNLGKGDVLPRKVEVEFSDVNVSYSAVELKFNKKEVKIIFYKVIEKWDVSDLSSNKKEVTKLKSNIERQLIYLPIMYSDELKVSLTSNGNEEHKSILYKKGINVFLDLTEIASGTYVLHINGHNLFVEKQLVIN